MSDCLCMETELAFRQSPLKNLLNNLLYFSHYTISQRLNHSFPDHKLLDRVTHANTRM